MPTGLPLVLSFLVVMQKTLVCLEYRHVCHDYSHSWPRSCYHKFSHQSYKVSSSALRALFSASQSSASNLSCRTTRHETMHNALAQEIGEGSTHGREVMAPSLGFRFRSSLFGLPEIRAVRLGPSKADVNDQNELLFLLQ